MSTEVAHNDDESGFLSASQADSIFQHYAIFVQIV